MTREAAPHVPGKPVSEGEAQSEDERREQLERLFNDWDSRQADEAAAQQANAFDEHDEAMAEVSRAWTFDPFRLWGTLTLLVVVVAIWVMHLVSGEVQYFMQRGQPPVKVGHAGELYAAGERTLPAPSNTYVTINGLFTTLESEGTAPGGSPDDVTQRFFLDPLFDVVVRTSQGFPEKTQRKAWSLEVDEAFIGLLERRRAFPEDLTVTIDVTGRLLRASDVPYWHGKPLKYFGQITGRDPREMWLMIDGDAPEAYSSYAAIFGAAILSILMSLGLFGRAWLHRRRERRA